MIKKLLIANRGEIVRRIIKACWDLDIKTVAVYSDADKDAYFLRHADETCNIGPANPVESYLNIEAMAAAIKKSGADAVHPGYGFLSENSAFAEAVMESGATWIGPPPSILKAIESKCYSRKIATEVNVPVVPGTVTPVKDVKEIHQFAAEYGYPIILKLDKGGGGKGIERIENEEQAQKIFERLSRIGTMAFGSPDVYIEKEIIKPRHIEIQFLVDKYNNCVCLGERECSIQRRYQKIIEESPSPVVTNEDREKLYSYTVRLAQSMGYQGAGTMEYLRDANGNFYFMEVNARLQVEHPVTEFLTGIDIVKTQLKIASGERLDITQEDVVLKGHAIEARVYAEDPVTFYPSPGTITKLSFPVKNEAYLRIDHAMEEGGTVPPYYDPMLAKVIAWDLTRPEAIRRLRKALSDFYVEGIKTTIPANLMIIESKEYQDGNLDTAFIEALLKKKN